jgi:hypothetical protein
MSSNLQDSINAVTGTAFVYKDYITGTCFTGSQTLGAGHDLISGKQGADLITKSLVGGTNVTLSSDDSTITINASAGGSGVPIDSTFAEKIPKAIIADYYYNGGAVKYKIQMPFFALSVDGGSHIFFEQYNEAWQNSTGKQLVLKFNDDAAGTVNAVTPDTGTYYFPDTTRTLSDYIASGDVIY